MEGEPTTVHGIEVHGMSGFELELRGLVAWVKLNRRPPPVRCTSQPPQTLRNSQQRRNRTLHIIPQLKLLFVIADAENAEYEKSDPDAV